MRYWKTKKLTGKQNICSSRKKAITNLYNKTN